MSAPEGRGAFPIEPPIEPMLAKLAEELPAGAFLYEPKWDGFRSVVFRGGAGDVFIQSRDLRPLDRYFPELHDVFLTALPNQCVVDGEIVIATPRGLDFDALQMRLHPAASRVARLAKETPASFVAFDLLAADGQDARERPQQERRERLERLLEGVRPPVHLTPMTRDQAVAREWLDRFEGAGLDGVIAKPEAGVYEAGKRAMIKVKHARTADCVVAGFRWHKAGQEELIGSLLLGLYDDRGRLHHVGVTSSFTMERRRELARELAPLRDRALVGTAAHRARVRGEVRPHAGRALPPRRGLRALASRQAAEGLPLRSARGHDSLRARARVRRHSSTLTPPQSSGISSGSSGSCGGRRGSGTCCRFTRMRNQV